MPEEENAGVSNKNIFLSMSCAIFFVFFSNVAAGAAGLGTFLSDVGEMLSLFAACACFVIAILAYEREANDNDAEPANDDT